MDIMDFFNSFMEEHHGQHQGSNGEAPKMPNFFEVDKKKVC